MVLLVRFPDLAMIVDIARDELKMCIRKKKIVLEKLFNLSSQLSFTKQTMLYLIGLGLSYESDITVRGLETVKKCKRVYLEAYTSILMAANQESLEKFYGREIILADRELVETGSDDILKDADKEDVAFLVVGDPFGATTHTDLVIRARELGIKVETIHNASVMNAVGACGLQLYQFGQTVSLVFSPTHGNQTRFMGRSWRTERLGCTLYCCSTSR